MVLTSSLHHSNHNAALPPLGTAIPCFTAGCAGAFVTLSRAPPEPDTMAQAPRHPPASAHLHHGRRPMPLTAPLPKSDRQTALPARGPALPCFAAGRAGAFTIMPRTAPVSDTMAQTTRTRPRIRPPARTSSTADRPCS